VQESGARPARLLERSVGQERSYRDLLANVPEQEFEAPRADTGLEAVKRVAQRKMAAPKSRHLRKEMR